MVKLLICGFGSIGRQHAQNAQQLGVDIRIWCVRKGREREVASAGFYYEESLEAGLAWCDGVVIAVATSRHMELARRAAAFGKAVYLEKPVSSDMRGVREFLAEAGNITVEVGCQLRRHPALLKLKEQLQAGHDGPVYAFQAWVGHRLDRWRPGTDYRQSYSASAEKGGGALYDLVHEIDLMRWLVGPMVRVSADLRQISDLEMSACDLANLILVAESGAAGVVQLDMLSPSYRRGLQIICQKAVYQCDFLSGELWRLHDGDRECLAQVPKGFPGKDLLQDAMAHFLARIDDPVIPPSCSLAEGIDDLEILLAAEGSSRDGRHCSLKGNEAV